MAAPPGYSRAQILLHWAVAILVAAEFLLAGGIETAFEARLRGFATPAAAAAAGWAHIATGAAVLALMLLLLGRRLRRGTPPPAAGPPRVLERLAHGVHLALYAVLLALPVAGLLAWAGRLGSAAAVHGALATLLWVLLALHLAWVAAHWLVWHSAVPRRMLRSVNEDGARRR